MKKLRIEYDGAVLFDADVDELTWTDSGGGVSVVGKFKTAAKGSGLADLLGAVAAGKKTQTANEVVRRHRELEREDL